MYSYVNKINVGANQDKSEVVLNLIQESPQFGIPQTESDGSVTFTTSIECNTVANIVVTREFAKEMARIILSIVEE